MREQFEFDKGVQRPAWDRRLPARSCGARSGNAGGSPDRCGLEARGPGGCEFPDNVPMIFCVTVLRWWLILVSSDSRVSTGAT